MRKQFIGINEINHFFRRLAAGNKEKEMKKSFLMILLMLVFCFCFLGTEASAQRMNEEVVRYSWLSNAIKSIGSWFKKAPPTKTPAPALTPTPSSGGGGVASSSTPPPPVPPVITTTKVETCNCGSTNCIDLRGRRHDFLGRIAVSVDGTTTDYYICPTGQFVQRITWWQGFDVYGNVRTGGMDISYRDLYSDFAVVAPPATTTSPFSFTIFPF